MSFTLLDKLGARVPGGPWSAQGVDVSKSGVRLEAGELPADVVKRLGDYDAEYQVELKFEVTGGSLPVVGVVRWLKDFPQGRWMIGVEYVQTDIGRGVAIARHFERAFTRPKTTRAAFYGAGIAAVLVGAFFLEAFSRHNQLVDDAKVQLDSAVAEKESIAVLLDTLEARLGAMSTTTSNNPVRIELAKEILSLRLELDRAREKVGERSVRLSQISLEKTDKPKGAKQHVARGDEFFNAGSLSAALHEYENAIAVDAKLPEPWLKAGIIHEFQERPVKALESYGRYLELRRDAPDWHEVNARVEHLSREANL